MVVKNKVISFLLHGASQSHSRGRKKKVERERYIERESVVKERARDSCMVLKLDLPPCVFLVGHLGV